ncbi:MAG: hypothetical protein IPK82_37685 [Polyangiaceae bacterium]|nr:hypothetical protein [Polyangiaceae bacterium]
MSALASVGGAPAVEALVYALADEEREVRRTAARGIGKLAALGDNAKLLNVVRASSDPELLAAAVRSAGDYLIADGSPPEVILLPPSRPPVGPRARGGSSAPPWIASHLAPKSPVPVAPSTHNLIAELSVMCEDPSPDVANAALDALRRAPTEVRVLATSRALGHREVDVVKTAVVKLSGARRSLTDAAAAPLELSSDVWEKLRGLLDHERADVRLLVAESICLLDPDRGRDALVERAQSERDSDVLMAIDFALSVAQRQKKGSGAS